MLRKRRGLGSIIGGVFMIIIISTAITYTTYSMNQVTQLAESVETKQVNDFERSNESFEVVKVRNDNNQFNMTVINTGDVPVHLTRLWVENTTDSTFPISKYNLDIALAPGASVYNIGQNLGLSVLDSQSYYAQLISERGNQKQLFLNSAADTSLFMRLTATPSVMPTTFATTVTLEIINTGTTQLLNLQPEMVSTVPTCNACTFNEIGTVNPPSFDSLSPGDTALFEWVYDLTGENGDQLTFTAGLLNDIRASSTTVTLQTIESALNAEVSLESGGLGDQVLIDDSIMIYHAETASTPGGEYQMWSGVGDGGGNGHLIELHNETPHFLTNNGSEAVTIPQGDWNIALMLKSDPVPNALDLGGGDKYDMIFHFEDGDGVPPDNSEGRAQLDLEECGVSNYNEVVDNTGENDAEERVSNGDMTTGSSDLDMPYSGNNENISAIRFHGVGIDQGTVVNSAIVEFVPDRSLSSFVSMRIFGESTEHAATFTNTDYDISSRNQTVAYVDWLNIPAWSDNQVSSATRTPDLSSIVQEIVDRPDWESGDSIVFMFYNQGTDAGDRREAHTEESDRSAPRLTMTWGSGAVPDWQDGTGPHQSGSYYFDGVQDCFRSAENVQSGNSLGSEEMSTALWFKTDTSGAGVSEEQYLVDWSGSDDYYRIGLDSIGRVFFEYATSSTDSNRLVLTQEYDDDIWHHVTVTLDTNPDAYKIVIHELNGVSTESASGSTSLGTSSVDVSGKWHVGGNVAEDGYFFKGWIDDVIHWDDHELIQLGQTQQIGDISKTNYGTGAHQFDLVIDLEDANGNFVSNIYTGTHNVGFADPKNGGDNDDWAYSLQNMTLSDFPQTVIGADQRMDVSFAWRDSTSTWEALDADMKIDDTTMNNPYPSYMQTPYPDRAFASYFIHPRGDEFRIFVTNTGTDGVFFVSQGTRVNFNGTLGSYAGLIHSVNGTGGGTGANDWWNIDEDRDSLYIPPGSNAEMYFHEATDVPSANESGDLIPAGIYKTTIWIQGYSDQGETFSRSVVVGSVTVTP